MHAHDRLPAESSALALLSVEPGAPPSIAPALAAELTRATARPAHAMPPTLDAALLRSWLRSAADRRLLILCASPAAWLSAAAAGEASRRLDDWARLTRLALGLTQAAPGRCLLIDAEEYQSAPERAVAALLRHLASAPASAATDGGEALATGPDQPAGAPASVSLAPTVDRWLARSVVTTQPRMAALEAERIASCLPLIDRPERPAAAEALHALEEWHSVQRNSAALQDTVARHERAVQAYAQRDEEAQRELARTANRLQSVQAEQAALALRLNHLDAEREQALSDLHDLSLLASGQASGLRNAAGQRAQAEAQRDALQTALTSAQQQLEHGTARQHAAEQALRQQLDTQREAREAAESALYDALEAAATARSQSDLALALARQAPTAGADLACFSVQVIGSRDQPPHRELRFAFWQIRTPRGLEPTLEARLVNHQGHPGLVLMAAPHRGPVTGLWQADGEEDGVPYMIVLPGEAGHQARLNRMGHSDWRFLLALAGRMRARVEADEALTRSWALVVRRLQQQLQALPARLRYDALDAATADAPGVLAVTLRPWSFGSLSGPQLNLRWQPNAAAGAQTLLSLTWRPDELEPPPFVQWPQDAQGSWQPRLDLPLGPDWSAERRRAWWAQTPEADRQLALALLDALPAAAEAAGGSDAEREPLRRAARQLLRDVQRDLRGLRWRHLARRWVGRA
jgi:hypothetical protein